MDEIVGLLVEQVAKRARDAAKRRAAAQPGGAPVPPRPRPAVAAAPAAVAAAPQAQVPRAPGIVTPRRVAPAAPVAPVAAPVAAEALLGAFSSAPAFLAAFVLSEALAPPVSLREPRVT